MDVEEIREGVLAILKELHEDIVTLVTELGEEFDVDITAKDFIAENFNSVDSLADMIARLLEE